MNGELSGGKNGIVYERQPQPSQPKAYSYAVKPEPMDFKTADIVFALRLIKFECGDIGAAMVNRRLFFPVGVFFMLIE